MSEPAKPIFNQKALDKMYGADDLNRALRITNPRFWTVLIACAVFLAGFLIWGIFGTVTSTVSATGVFLDGKLHCFLTDAEASEMQVGNTANVNGALLTVSTISDNPLSREESRAILRSDYLVDTLLKEKWAYHVILDGNPSVLKENVPVQAHIITKRMAPISLILGGED